MVGHDTPPPCPIVQFLLDLSNSKSRRQNTAMAGIKGGTLQGPPSCSVCFEAVNDASERSIAKLTCGHQFHLDCIGSAFNAKGSMQCPNCRRIEHGQWLYASGGRQREDSFLEDLIIEEDYDLFAGVSELLFPHDYMVAQVQWCPYQGSFYGSDTDHHLPAHPNLVFNVLVGENLESSESLHPCPLILAQTPALVTHVSGAEDNERLQESLARRLHQGAQQQRQFPYTRGQWGYQPPAALAPIGLVGGFGLPEGSRGLSEQSRWLQLENPSAGHAPPPQARYHGRPFTPAQSLDNHPASQFSSVNWDYAGQSAQPNANMEPESGTNLAFTQRRQEGVSAFRQYPSEREGQRWAPPPLSGLYGAHGILGSELPTQAEVGTAQIPSQFQATLLAFQPYPTAENIDGQSSSSFYPPR